MTDWTQFVRDRLRATAMNLTDSIIAELAAHLEETYELASSEGLAEPEAFKRALQEIPNWRVLAEDIQRATSKEDPMNHRTKTLWLPALASLLGASVVLTLIEFSRFSPRLVWIGGIGMSFYWPWLVSLPLFGAAGAYLSHRARGSVRSRIVAGLSPAWVMLIIMALILPFGLAIDGLHFFILVAFGIGLLNWVILPGFALLVGALPFLHFESQRST